MYSQYPPQSQPYPPPQPEKKQPNYWLVGCFGCGGALALVLGAVVLFFVVANMGGSDEAAGSGGDSPAASAPEEAAPADEEQAGGGQEQGGSDGPVEFSAEPAEYRPGALTDGSDYVAVQVTITNNGDETLSLNPLYFSMEDGSGQTRSADLVETAGQDEGLEVAELATGDSASGVVVFPGTADPVAVTYEGMLGDTFSTEVS